MATVREATLQISAERLLASIWFSDGSGASWPGSGIDGIPEDWEVTEISFPDAVGEVTIRIRRKEEKP